MNQETAQKRRKVMFLVTKSNFGGAQRYVFDLARNLDRVQFESVVAAGPSQGSKEPGALFDKLASENIRTVCVPELARDVSFADISALRALIRLLRTERPDAVHLNSSKVGGLGALAARIAGVPKIVFTSHGLAYDEPRSPLARFVIFIFTWLTFLLAHAVIFLSAETAARARRLPFCGDRVHLVYNGIESPLFLPRDAARKDLLTCTSPIESGAIWIGTIAELVPNKGLGYALRACEELKRSERKFVFFVIGSGDQEKILTDTIRNRGLDSEVRMLGYVSDAARLLKAFDIFALTSSKEGLPYVLLEAGCAGVPVVGTDIAGIRDIVENGVSGALANPKDPQECADALCELIDDPQLRNHFGTALQKRVSSIFDLEKMVRQTASLY